MKALTRYLGLWASLAKFSLLGELAFRGNFIVKVLVEFIWLGLLLLFNYLLYRQTNTVGGWEENQYLFFVGIYFAMGGVLEMLFLDNCNNFADLVRSGDLDFFLLQPVDEQFLISCRKVDWSCAPNILLGAAVMGMSLWNLGKPVEPGNVVLFLAMFACGVGLAYGFVLMLTAASVWFVRNQSLFEMWWLFTTLMRYPREIFNGPWSSVVGHLFWFAIPIMLVTNVPARVMVRAWELETVLYTFAATVAVLWVSRRFFRMALQRYRSASS